MSTISPTKRPLRTLSRQPSSPSLAVGLPPSLPESNIMQPSSSSSSLAKAGGSGGMPRTKSRKRIHRGDVSSTASSDEDDTQITPKRKVIISSNEDSTSTPNSAKKPTAKKMTLQERLQAAAAIKEGGVKAKLNKSKSTAESLTSSTSVSDTTAFTTANSAPVPAPKSEISNSSAPSSIISQRTMGSSSAAASSVTSMSAGSSAADKVVVCVRIKPTSNPFAATAYDITPTSLSLSDEHPKVKQRGGKAGREDGYTYTFDKLLQFPSTTPQLYAEKVAPLVDKAMNGFNSTIFAYGQTGSGKSFTMTGIPEELGVIPCAVDGVFDAITAEPDRAFLLRVSYIEIYNETLRDLLNFKKGPLRDDEKPSIHTSKGKVYVDPLIEEIVSTPQDVMDLLERGNVGRRIGATDWNERSSRSHCVFTIVIESRPRDVDGDEDIRLSRLNLIDLAGSERAVSDSERRGEGKHINQSLLALREVVHKLTEQGKVTHIPYRNSKLTHLLENALGGDSNICVICTMSGEEEHCAETLETLKFAGRCSQVKTNAKKNILPSSERALIRAKDQEIEELKLRLQGLAGQTPQRAEPDVEQISGLAESVAAMEMRKAKLTTQLAKLNGEILTSELPRSGSGLPLSPPKPKRRRISDFSALVAAPGRMGLGVGTPNKMNDRRAISGMTRVSEVEEEMPGILGTLDSADSFGAKSFDHERALAALRRALAVKERELVSANRELSEALSKASQLGDAESRIATLEADLRTALESHASLRASLEQAENNIRDQTSQLEGTRAELVATIEDKSSKIDQLENKVLDLRKSREEVIMEDQQRLDEVQKKLDNLTAKNEEDRINLDAVTRQLSETKKKADDAEWYRAEEVERHKSELAKVLSRQGDASAALDQLKEYEARNATKVQDLLAAQLSKEAEIATLHDEKVVVERQRDEARMDLDRFQKEVLNDETRVLGELREEIGNLRKLREDDKRTWERRKVELDEEIQVERIKVEEKLREKNEDKEKIDGLKYQLQTSNEREQKLSTQMSEALKTLGEAAKANSSLEDRLTHEVAARQALESDRETHDNRLVAQVEEANVARRKAEDQLAQIGQLLEERDTVIKANQVDLEREIETRKEVEGHLASLTSDMNAAKTLAESRKIAKEEVERKVSQLEQQLEAATSSSGDHQQSLSVEITARQSAESQLELVTRQLDSYKTTLTNKETQLTIALDDKDKSTKKIEELSRQVESLLEVEKQLGIESEERKTAERRGADLARQLEDVVASSDNDGKRLAEEIKARQGIECQLVELRRELEEARTTIRDLERRLAESSKNQEQVTALTKELDNVKSTILEKEEKFIMELAKRQELEQEIIDVKRQAAGSADIQVQLEKQIDARELLEKRLVQSEKSVSNSEERVKEEVVARRIAEKRLADLEGVEAKLKTEINARQIAEKRLVDLDQSTSSFDNRLNNEITARQSAEKQLNDLQKSASDVEGRLNSEISARQAAEQRLVDQDQASSSINDKLEIEIAARQSAEKRLAEVSLDLVRNHESAQKILEDEILSLRQALKVSQAEMQEFKVDATTITQLTFQLEEAERRKGEKDVVIADLMKRSRSRASLRASLNNAKDESGEISRLETVIEAMEGIINEQREKIERWAKEMEKQREIVRLLTNDPNFLSTTPNPITGSPAPSSSYTRGHGKSQSVAIGAGVSGGIGKGLPGTFTARNLALPSAASAVPSPLPMHPSQFDNTSIRKGRRVTIEHDIDRLAEGSKVNKAKALFESPDKLSTPPRLLGLRSSANAPNSIPRQRRP